MKSVWNWQIGRVSSSIARSHVSLHTRQKLMQLGWDVLSSLAIPSPDLAPSDYHLFRFLQNSLNGKNLDSLEVCKNYLEQLHRSERCQVLGEWNHEAQRWRKIVEQNDTYVIE